MLELRWILALVGVLFIAGLAWWEMRRGRRVPASERSTVLTAEPSAHDRLELPHMRAREPLHDLPVLTAQPQPPPTAASGEAPEPASEPVSHSAPAPAIQSAALAPAGALAAAAAEQPEPIVEWPEEAMRRVLALRLVAPGERFAGRAVRQALAAEGFILGKHAIFHRCAADGRAVVSAANLNKPGTFDREDIDTQLFGGLNLFAVLPGPLPPTRAFDELLAAARNLNERLQGALQDERGEPLTPVRSAALRDSLAPQRGMGGGMAAH
ncbi:MAG TPA: cell division protein ZipA C-terminal FtsZ-binding domain-containing protein [Steroidobacteraceae bacterium]|nr:cell division protein ZipA C-terminal FtsZ-binding domain-containing protein [Steroidobacteraceae bacterium]